MRALLRSIGVYIVFSVLLGLVWIAFSYPRLPATACQWLWMLVPALPVRLAAECVGERLWRNRLTRFVEQETATTSFSLVRILYAVLLLLVCTGLLLGAAYGWQVFRPFPGLA